MNVRVLGLVPRRELELLSGDGHLSHETAIADHEGHHALHIFPAGGGVVLTSARGGIGTSGPGAGRSTGGDRHDTGIRPELEGSGSKLIESPFIFEENNLAEGLAARLEADAELRHRDVAVPFATDVDTAFAMCAADDKGALAHRRKHRVGVAIAEEAGARAGILEHGYGFVIAARVVRRTGRYRDHRARRQNMLHQLHTPYRSHTSSPHENN